MQLGQILDLTLLLDNKVASVVKSAFYHLRLVRHLHPFLGTKEMVKVNLVLITSKPDHCNVLYARLPLKADRKLQWVRHAVATVVNGTIES